MRLICALSIAFALGATPAFADDPPKYEPKIIPKCKLVKAADGREVCAYTLKEWVEKVLPADAELVSKRTLLDQEKKRSATLSEQVRQMKTQTDSYADSQKILVEYNATCTQARIDLDKKYQKERVKPRLGSPVAWTIAAVSAAVMAGFVVRGLTD